MDIYRNSREDRDTILLTEHAKFDPQIVRQDREASLNANKTVVLTTGLLKALQGKGTRRSWKWSTPAAL